jgi:hypothetical protein
MLIRLLGAEILIACSLLPAAAGDRVQLTLDTSEADQALAILTIHSQGQPVPDAEWRKLFATAPYQRLKQRETAIGKKLRDRAAFTDDAFKLFLLSDALAPHTALLSTTIARWKRADLRKAAERVLAYLPADATIHAKVYPVLKPGVDGFVWDLSSDPAIFLYLQPNIRVVKFENNVAHELYHIGLASVGPVYSRTIATLPAPARATAEWMSALGEGTAVLAAAGGPTADPHAASSAQERARWERGMGWFNDDLPVVDRFFQDVLNGALAGNAVQDKGRSFYGLQGPWFTLGYKMSSMVEERFGRQALIDAALDPRCLLVLYNRTAAEQNSAGKPTLPLWSADTLSGVQAGTCGQP